MSVETVLTMPEETKLLPEVSSSPLYPEPIKTLTLDLETTGLDPRTDKIHCVSFRLDGSGPVYSFLWPNEEGKAYLRRILSNPNISLRGHNIKFDALFLAYNGVSVEGSFDDTRLLAYLNIPEADHGLKGLTENLLNRPVVRMDDFAVKVRKKLVPYFEASPRYAQIGSKFYLKSKLVEYNKADVKNCDDLKAYFPTPEWYVKVEQPVLKLLYQTELRGVRVNVDHLQSLNIAYLKEIAEIDTNYPGMNPNSSTEMAVNVFMAKGIKLPKTDKGNHRLDKTVLKDLAFMGDEDAQRLLRRREIVKLQTTYTQPLVTMADYYGRIHGSFNQAGRESMDATDTKGTATGRLTSSNPNLQNIPSRTAEGKNIRKAFIASNGYRMFDADLKQIEPRVLAHFSQSPKLIKAYREGLDTHGVFGSLIFNKPIGELSKLERFIGKTCWLASVYGATPERLQYICELNSPEQLGLDLDYFRNVQRRFWDANPELVTWKANHLARARMNGGITTFGGRFVRIANLGARAVWLRSEAERTAVNYLIQGSAADCMKLILVRFYNEVVKPEHGAMLACVHDEILGEIKEKDGNPVVPLDLLKDIMCNTFTLNNVPVDSDIHWVNSWADKG